MDLPQSSGKILVICPHFDDACFSAGGLLLKKKSAEIEILTVFSKSQSAPNLRLLKVYPRVYRILNFTILRKMVTEYVSRVRQEEDRRFCDSLGAIQNVLPFMDSGLRGYTAPCRTNAGVIDKEPIYGSVLEAIGKCVFSKIFDSILCPLGLGNHVDHLIVLKAFLQILKKDNITTETLFYEDLPYASAYSLDFISFLAWKRIGSNKSLLVDITNEISLKKNLIETYYSQLTRERKERNLYHARRLYMLRENRVDAEGYCERFWISRGFNVRF